MKTTKNWAALLAAMGLAAGLAFGGTAAATVITLTPENTFYLDIGGENSEPELFGPTVTYKDKGTDTTVGGANYTDDTTRLELLYKSDFGGSDSGDFSSSYTTTFSPDSSPSDATITWVVNEPHIICPDCYLAIKDGDAGYYTFNLNDVSTVSTLTGAWDGKATIEMVGFWKDIPGAISHVAIWGDVVEANGGQPNGNDVVNGNGIPEPASIALFGGGMLALGWAMRRRTRKGDLG